ncbi:hypothetical protein BKK79_06635 [Cupriavidus sp. USMAA2-4]|uniref:HAD family hydrolase n=1 Tax=Cupriavidus sp. USMAA2-4 TaxID=876364 RepID=UPI0008A694E9|nr:HAD family hydrolase [Cupriavidus sp. USMAA2-4]AOY91526.1 hypothetical protein BKK79_06635 [Cupriavidus sp. USMAA2-4]
MAHPKRRDTVVVLDLDDTLYKEADYQISGIQAVCQQVREIYGLEVTEDILELKQHGGGDIFEGICRLAGLPSRTKESLLWIYRLHEPKIALSHETREAVLRMQSEFLSVAILTDGRSISQRKKLRALELEHIPVYISEEHGSEKPDPLRFRLIMRDFPAEKYLYVGDNPSKDFIAPNLLGWDTACLVGSDRNIHPQQNLNLRDGQAPVRWIDSLRDLFEISNKNS